MCTKEIKHLWSYKDLFVVLVWRELSIHYKQAVFGIAWAVIPPLSLMMVFTILFTYIFPVHIGAYPKPIFYYSGLLPWSFFSSALYTAIPSLQGNYRLIKKAYFPRIILPATRIVMAATSFVIASLLFIGMLLFYKIPFTVNMLWFFPLAFLLLLFTLSVALILSALNVYYRDVGLATNFLIQLWFFATPVFYSVNSNSPRMHWLLLFNPIAFIIESLRKAFLDGQPVPLNHYLAISGIVLVMFIMSYKFFKTVERKFADVI
jgi:ABC-type polysaccharide/polyol phosphate export permease